MITNPLPFLEDVSKKLNLWLFGDGTQDIADVYMREYNAEWPKNRFPNKCAYCGQYGKRHSQCEYCGAPIN
jgi:hypothetical protein